ncbi:phosphatidylserine/phosphatidylglycerophosphate/cardiolipin synthase family protein [Pseudomaricurvus alkylphenolicus]|jgi:cardiolipin synthase|uniref:phospholipase D-like domain-containing protein n=1 Tax=Pseudomaricurvus alkylphenolicus TaxID=1306991 RepID=UPI001422BC71|nr:phosphatidylserine/phosphatidylglycerophosphate/cardiolipin synthase family protein [Pseudomaricurvus alkylphenolicus]NIB43740.1 phosphatidylserine/phosphatidylglycerophosphate/cardiolipin synthase family protein [Pseudomaricurvus alkylphenolicus]
MSLLKAPDPKTHSGWSQEALYDDASAYFEALIRDCDQACRSIDLEVYIFSPDAIGQRLAASLCRARDRGVQVRVLIDAVGSYRGSAELADQLECNGIEVKVFHPLPWQIHHYHRAVKRGDFLTKFLYLVSRVNQRDHRKLCLVDNRFLWSGSFNISVTHLPPGQGGEGWQDIGVRVCGGAVTEISQHFDSLWNRSKAHFGSGLFSLYWNNLSVWTRRRKNQLLVRHIEAAKQQVWVASAYFAPSHRVITALKRARRKGVDVRIVVPSHSDIGIFPFLTATYYADLLASDIAVYEYQARFLHAKALIIDEVYLIGSTNFNHRSFLHDLELDIRLWCEESQTHLQHWMTQLFKQSEKVLSERRDLASWLLGKLALLLRYWM